MFLLNSCLGLFSAASSKLAPLLPKLRGHFAEFLNNASPVGLRILSSSTCVGLRYGYLSRNSSFSRQCGFMNFSTLISIPITLHPRLAVFPTRCDFVLGQRYHSLDSLSSCVPAVLIIGSTGIWTSCPSTTTFVLALGPDLPRADQLYSGNLGYSAYKILTCISLLIPAFSLQTAPQLLTVLLRRSLNAPLPIQLKLNSIASVVCFSPGHFRRKISRLVSYYALFEWVAASKPTS